MPRCFRTTRSLQRLVTFLSLAAYIGCTNSTTPIPASPPFKLPLVGDSTDTVVRIGDPFPGVQTVDLDGNPINFNEQLLHDG